MSSPSILSTAEYYKLSLIAAGVDLADIPPILDTATWRHMMLAALYQISSGGGGGGYIDGVVDTYNDLPVTVGTPALNTVYLVRFGSGVWLINRHPAGLYIRIANNGTLADWEYLGTFPEVQSDLRWRVYNETDPTKEVALDVSNVTTGTLRTLAVPNASGRIQIEGQPIGDVSPSSGAFTTLSATGTATLPHIHGALAGNLYIHVKNVSGVQLSRGTPVYVVGNVGATDRVEVAAADFDDPTKMPAVGLLEQTLANNADGNAVIVGELDNADTSLYTLNQELFVGNNGAITGTRPTSGQIQSVGTVARVQSSTGVIVVNMQGTEFAFQSPPPIGSVTRNSGAFTTLNATNGTITASAPVLDLSQTWNNAAVTFTGLRFNVTNTASATASPLIDLQVGGVSRMRMTRGGTLHLSEHSNSGLYSPAPVWNGSTAGLLAATNLAVGSSLDTILERGGAGILEQRNGVNAQTFRLYNTFTDASNHERGFLRWSSNVLQIGTEAGGTGSNRNIEFQAGGATRAVITAGTGIFWVNGLVVGNIGGNPHLRVITGGDGIVALFNSSGGDFNRIQFGGTTSSFPALKRSSTTLQVRLADDSAFAPLEALSFTTANSRIVCDDANTVIHVGNTPRISLYGSNATYLGLGNAHDIRWSNTGRSDQATTFNISLARDADGILAQRAGTTAQTWRIYNTSTSSNANFERANFRWASNEFIIDAEAGGTGTSLRGIKIGSATSSLLGFYGVTPVDQPATVADPAGGGTVDTQARTAINAIIDRLQELGLIA